MSIIDLVKDLQNAFEAYDIIIHQDLLKDLAGLLNNAGIKKEFLAKFKKNLSVLSEYSTKAHLLSSNQFERLKKDDNLFSMHIKGKTFNIRIIYSFLSDNTILLHGFYERSGKRSTDYFKAIDIAKQRLDEFEKE